MVKSAAWVPPNSALFTPNRRGLMGRRAARAVAVDPVSTAIATSPATADGAR
jgi:hypothetical protein